MNLLDGMFVPHYSGFFLNLIYECHVYVVESFLLSYMYYFSLLLSSLPWQIGKWRTRKTWPVVSEEEENPSLLGLPAPCSILYGTHLSTSFKCCMFSRSTIFVEGGSIYIPNIFGFNIEVNHRKIYSFLCYLIYSVLSKCQVHILVPVPLQS